MRPDSQETRELKEMFKNIIIGFLILSLFIATTECSGHKRKLREYIAAGEQCLIVCGRVAKFSPDQYSPLCECK